MTILHAVDPSDFRDQAWANGGGRTLELAAGPDREHWRWRISMATVDGDGAFSALPGVRRQLAPLDGSIELHFEDGSRRSVNRLEVIMFDGGVATRCHLLDGPGRDINLMLREDQHGELIVRPLLGPMLLPAAHGLHWFVFLVSGHAQVNAGHEQVGLDGGHALWVGSKGPVIVRIEGDGDIVLVRLRD